MDTHTLSDSGRLRCRTRGHWRFLFNIHLLVFRRIGGAQQEPDGERDKAAGFNVLIDLQGWQAWWAGKVAGHKSPVTVLFHWGQNCIYPEDTW